MGEERRRPFELEDDPPDPPPSSSSRASPPRPAPDPDLDVRDPGPAPSSREAAVPPGTEDGVDTRTAGPLPNPPDWPAEMLSYPFRGEGPGALASIAAPFVLLDLAGLIGGVYFLALIVKLFLCLFMLRGQLALVSRSAMGRDKPEGWWDAMGFDESDVKSYGWFLLWAAPVVLAGVIAHSLDQELLGYALLAIGSVYAAVVALSFAMGDRRIRMPWNAPQWIARAPGLCLLGAAGWWTLWVGEAVARHQRAAPFLVGLFAILAVRFACAFALVVSARALGVLGRRWE